VLAGMQPPDPTGGFPAIRTAAVSAHAALRRHPWAATMLMSSGGIRPARINNYMEALLASLRGAGLSAETTYHAYHVIDAHIIGFSLWASTHGKMPEHIENVRAWFEETVPMATLPYLHEHGLQHFDDGPLHDVSAFEFALDLLLGSLERLES
jgi:Tetracyclin repressor-like, C-terminal domain